MNSLSAGTSLPSPVRINSTLLAAMKENDALLYVSAAGAGLRLQTALWDVPGASRWLVGFSTPYARTQLQSFIGHEPDSNYVSSEVALDLAMAAFLRAAEHQVVEGLPGSPIGLGITATVGSTRRPKGRLRAHLALITKKKVLLKELPLGTIHGQAARKIHDQAIAEAALFMLEEAFFSDKDPNQAARDALALQRFFRYPIFATNGRRFAREEGITPGVDLAATLNPIHEGHRAMCRAAEADIASAKHGHAPRIVRYLVSSSSPHKGRLSVQEMLCRAGMLRAERWRDESRLVEFTQDEPLFIDKARRRPGSIFLLGADTMARMLNPNWGIQVEEMLSAFARLDVKFKVMGRVVAGRWTTCRDISVPWPHQTLFEPLGGRLDLSSSELRGTPCR